MRKYLGVKCVSTKEGLVDAGYVTEKLTLDFMTRKIGTCVLAGSYKHDIVKEIIEIEENEILVAFLPIGYIKEGSTTKQKLQRKVIHADNRKNTEELFFNQALEPLKIISTELEQVRLSPSSLNVQPWRVIETDQTLDFYVEKSERNKKKMGYDVQYVDIGIALYNYAIDKENIEYKVIDNFISKYEYIISIIK